MGKERKIRVIASVPASPVKGSVGLETQMPGQTTTISGIAMATGGIGGGKQIQSDI